MRLIDADALIEKIRKLPNAGIRWLVSAEAVFDTILNAPTIEPRKGKWVRANTPTDGIYECSVCLQWTFIPFHPSTYNYCPRCGSDMRGDDDEI